MRKSCPYCSNDVTDKMNSDKADCSFCEMEVTPTFDGKRAEQTKAFTLDITKADMELPTRELMGWNTLNLMQLLKMLREERRDFYNHMRIFKKAGNQTDQFKGMEEQSGDHYEILTMKTWAVENILRNRIGYIPRKVTQNLLENLYCRMSEERNFKPMVIRGKEQQHKRRKTPDKTPEK